MKINCSKTENFLKEKARMTKTNKNGCTTLCAKCPLSMDYNGLNIPCDIFIFMYPQKAVEIVQKWSDEHPQKSMDGGTIHGQTERSLR